MAKDDRLYGKFVLDLPDHPKIRPLSDAAFRCLIEATLWSRKHLTNGFLTKRLALAMWPPEVLRELSTNDPVKPSLIETEDGWHIHDFAEHQITTDEIDALREVRKAAGRRGGLAKAEAKRKQTASKTPSKTYPENREQRTEVTTSVVTYVGTEPESVAPVANRANKRGTRLDPAWMPQQSTIDAIKAETGATREELTAQHRKFVDYWTEKTGQSATKLSWEGTWRNWMRTAHEHGDIGKKTATAPNGKQPHKLRALADLAAKAREMENVNGKALEA